MSFLKDFKEDFSDAVDELVPGGDTSVDEKDASNDVPLDTSENDIDVTNELNKLDGLLQKASEKAENGETQSYSNNSNTTYMEEKEMDSTENENVTTESTVKPVVESKPQRESAPASDENAVITSGMSITGDLTSTGSIAVEGLINGNVQCNGKLTVTGTINGNSSSAEFFADSAHIQGEVTSTGTVKVGVGSVIIGNISATSAVIAGAVKGDIDVQGPVVVDTSAVVMGNIKSRSVQINNGAVIEGFCSQAYADIDVAALFEEAEQ